jgi:ADP-heptose:LPS heptosyltransferase
VLAALRRRYPTAHIAWVVNKAYEPLLIGHPDLDATLPFDRGLISKSPLRGAVAALGFLRLLRREAFDLVLDLQGLLRSGLMTWATRAARRVGFSSAREGASWFYTDRVPGADFERLHAVDRYWLMAEALGVGDGPKLFQVPIATEARSWAERTLAAYPQPWLMVAVGARWVTKRWPPAHFAELLRRTQNQFGGTAVFVGAGDDTPLSQTAIRELKHPSLDLTGQTSIPQLAAILERADVMMANDTGPLHLAVALGRPVVAPYTCTKVRLTGPYGAGTHGVESRLWCQGSYLRKCGRLECMTELSPDRLWSAVVEVMESWQTRSRSA